VARGVFEDLIFHKSLIPARAFASRDLEGGGKEAGMLLRSSLITGATRTLSWDFNFIKWWSEAGFAPAQRRPGGNSDSL